MEVMVMIQLIDGDLNKKVVHLTARYFVCTQSQSTDVPTGQGFATSLKMDCTTAQCIL